MGTTASPRAPAWRVGRLIAWLGLAAASAQAAPAKAPGCLIEPEQIADVGSPVTGVVAELAVALGEEVRAGQTLVRLRADVERANAKVAGLRTRVDAEVKAAHVNWDLARQKVERTKQLVSQNFVSVQALDQAEAEAEVAAQKFKLAQSQQKIYAREETVAQAQLGLRTLRSPITGVVVERYSNVGERVEERPIVRVASIDPLRVSLMVPIAQYGQLAIGNALVIRPELPGIAPVHATVTYIDKVVDAASNTFRVRLRLPNPANRLPGGMRCKADWPVLGTSAPASAPAPAAPSLPVTRPTAARSTPPAPARPSPSATQRSTPAARQTADTAPTGDHSASPPVWRPVLARLGNH
jgi:membrane fusion protein, heavy metal efflux system